MEKPLVNTQRRERAKVRADVVPSPVGVAMVKVVKPSPPTPIPAQEGTRVIIIGKAPKELVDILGYNPVVDLDKEHFSEQVEDILANLGDYQKLVDRNRETAMKLGDWKCRIAQMRETLSELGYEI